MDVFNINTCIVHKEEWFLIIFNIPNFSNHFLMKTDKLVYLPPSFGPDEALIYL